MIARLLKFLSVVFYFRSIPAKESRNGAKKAKQNRKPRQLVQKQNNKERPENYSDYVIDVIKFFSFTFVKSKHSCWEIH